MAGVGRIVTGAVPSVLRPASQVPQCATAPGMADGTLVTATVGNGGLTPSVLSIVEEWLALNASVRRAGERQGRLSLTTRGGLERGRDELSARG